ncbi:MAG: TonB-dependent receptor, partial [Desulfobulbaceae bacterium]|nr:TonB-dependent receptor [Desulfobulbaceae bacterium]
DQVEVAQEDGSERATARYRNRVGWAKVETDWSSNISSSTIFSVTDIANIRSGQSSLPDVMTGTVDDSRKFRVYALTQDWQISESEAWSLRIGFDIKNLDADYAYESTLAIYPPFDQIFDNMPLQQRNIALAPTGEQYATYIEARWKATSNLILDLGLRWDRQSYSSKDNNEQRSPRLNVLYKFGDDTEFRVGVGRFYQAQEINELQVSDGLSDFLPPQYSDHFVAGLVHRFDSGLSLRAEYYQKDYGSPMPRFENAFDSLVLIPELQIDRVQVVAEKAFVKGAELTLSGDNGANGLLWWASYVWASTEDRVAETDVRRSWDQKHSIKAGISTKLGAWDVSAAGTWRSGWPQTKLIIETTQSPDGSTELAAITTPRNSLNYATFNTLDARASRTFQLPRSELTTFIEVSNLYNRRNQCCTQYTVEVGDNGSRTVKANRSSWLPIVPSVGIVWRF